jgi:hypothetical protein
MCNLQTLKISAATCRHSKSVLQQVLHLTPLQSTLHVHRFTPQEGEVVAAQFSGPQQVVLQQTMHSTSSKSTKRAPIHPPRR